MGKHPPFGISLQYILGGTTQIYVPFNISAYVPVREYVVDHLAILQSRALGLPPLPWADDDSAAPPREPAAMPKASPHLSNNAPG